MMAGVITGGNGSGLGKVVTVAKKEGGYRPLGGSGVRRGKAVEVGRCKEGGVGRGKEAVEPGR